MANKISNARGFFDYDTIRQNVFDNVVEGLQTQYPLENDNYRLELSDLKYSNQHDYTLKEQKDAILRRQSLSRPLRGRWTLIDKKTNTPIDQKKALVARIPYLTGRGTYILNGNEYTLANQARLKSGVYTRVKDNGEHEAHFNILEGGPPFRIHMEPDTGVFRMQVGQAQLKLYPILHELGISDHDLAQQWGGDLLQANIASTGKRGDATVSKAWAKLARNRAKKEVGGSETKSLKEVLNAFKLNPEVTNHTLGKGYDSVTPDVLIRATQKLINIQKGEESTDDRDSLLYQAVYGPEDLFKERFEKDGGQLNKRLLWQAGLRNSLAGLKPGELNKQIDALFHKSGLAQPLEEINLLDAADQNTRLTRLGAGGIPTREAIPLEARNVQPSYFGFIDPIRTPESGSVGVDTRLTHNTFRGDDNKLRAKVKNIKTGKIELQTPEILSSNVVAFPGELKRAADNGYKTVQAMENGKIKYVSTKDVNYELPTSADMFNFGSNLVPITEGIKGGRLLMGSKMLAQALPLKDAETPLVSSANVEPGAIGSLLGTVKASEPGQVVSVSKDAIKARSADGKLKTYNLYNDFPLNRKSVLNSRPQVKRGDTIKPGQLLAATNMTDNEGTQALGKNLRVGYLPYKGLTYEDAIVISESAARKLSSEQMYTKKFDIGGQAETSLKKFRSLFPSIYDNKQLDRMDDSGIIKPGQIVFEDDPVILGLERKTGKGAGMLYKGKGTPFKDTSVKWDHSTAGVVTDAWSDGSSVKVAIKTLAPMEVGDKMCFDPETFILTRRGWKAVANITYKDEIATLNPDTDELEWQYPTHLWVYDHIGKMYYLNTKHINMLVTPNHRLWAAKPHGDYHTVLASEMYKSKAEWRFKKDCRWTGIKREYINFEPWSKSSPRDNCLSKARMDDWLEFLGYYIAEGRCCFQKNQNRKCIRIAQNCGEVCDKIEAVIQRLGLRYYYDNKSNRFIINSCWLYAVLSPLGNSHTKYVPAYVQELCPRQLKIFFNAYMAGDGYQGTCSSYTTASERLAYDMQLICMKLGWAATVKKIVRTNNHQTGPCYRARINKKQLRPWWKKGRIKYYDSVKEDMIDYNGKVYSITVPNHVVYCRRWDKTYWSHNSGRYG